MYIHTNGFTFNDAYILAGILHYQFNLYVTVQNHANRPVIYVNAKSIALLRTIVTPYIHSSIIYKINRGIKLLHFLTLEVVLLLFIFLSNFVYIKFYYMLEILIIKNQQVIFYYYLRDSI